MAPGREQIAGSKSRLRWVMNSRFLSSVAVLMLWTVSLKPLSSAQSNFSSFDFPGAINTPATGITPSGDIVGREPGPEGNNDNDPTGST